MQAVESAIKMDGEVGLHLPVIPKSTLASMRKRMSMKQDASDDIEDSIYSPIRSLTTAADVEFLTVTAQYRDKANNGMSRKEMIDMIMKVTSCKKWKTAENHFDYLIREEKLPNLKHCGRVVAAQKTTTKRG